jgi:hypothetical protein
VGLDDAFNLVRPLELPSPLPRCFQSTLLGNGIFILGAFDRLADPLASTT